MVAAARSRTGGKRPCPWPAAREPKAAAVPDKTVGGLRVLARQLRVVPYKRVFQDLSNYCSMPRSQLEGVIETYRRAARAIQRAVLRLRVVKAAVLVSQRAWRGARRSRASRAERTPANETDVVTHEPLPRAYPRVWKRRSPEGKVLGYDLRATYDMLVASRSFQDPLRWRESFSAADVRRMCRQLDDLDAEEGEHGSRRRLWCTYQRHCSEVHASMASERDQRRSVMSGLTRQMEGALSVMLQIAERDQPGLTHPGTVAVIDLAQSDLPPEDRNPVLAGFAAELEADRLSWENVMEAQQLIDLMMEPFIQAMNDAVQLDPVATEHFLTAQISLLENLPMLGTCCFQATIQRFVVNARSRLQRMLNNPFSSLLAAAAAIERRLPPSDSDLEEGQLPSE